MRGHEGSDSTSSRPSGVCLWQSSSPGFGSGSTWIKKSHQVIRASHSGTTVTASPVATQACSLPPSLSFPFLFQPLPTNRPQVPTGLGRLKKFCPGRKPKIRCRSSALLCGTVPGPSLPLSPFRPRGVCTCHLVRALPYCFLRPPTLLGGMAGSCLSFMSQLQYHLLRETLS